MSNMLKGKVVLVTAAAGTGIGVRKSDAVAAHHLADSLGALGAVVIRVNRTQSAEPNARLLDIETTALKCGGVRRDVREIELDLGVVARIYTAARLRRVCADDRQARQACRATDFAAERPTHDARGPARNVKATTGYAGLIADDATGSSQRSGQYPPLGFEDTILQVCAAAIAVGVESFCTIQQQATGRIQPDFTAAAIDSAAFLGAILADLGVGHDESSIDQKHAAAVSAGLIEAGHARSLQSRIEQSIDPNTWARRTLLEIGSQFDRLQCDDSPSVWRGYQIDSGSQ